MRSVVIVKFGSVRLLMLKKSKSNQYSNNEITSKRCDKRIFFLLFEQYMR